jgi:hypothetical protein
MPDIDEPAPKDPKTGDVIRTLFELLIKDEEFKRSLGRRTTYLILATLAVATAELTIGLPIITLASTPIVGTIIVFLIAQVEDWIRSRRPKTIFYLCPNFMCPKEGRFYSIKWSSLPQYRKLRSCPACGSKLIKRCRQRNHYIISPDLNNPDAPPTVDSFCPFCDPSLPSFKRKHLATSVAESAERDAPPTLGARPSEVCATL